MLYYIFLLLLFNETLISWRLYYLSHIILRSYRNIILSSIVQKLLSNALKPLYTCDFSWLDLDLLNLFRRLLVLWLWLVYYNRRHIPLSSHSIKYTSCPDTSYDVHISPAQRTTFCISLWYHHQIPLPNFLCTYCRTHERSSQSMPNKQKHIYSYLSWITDPTILNLLFLLLWPTWNSSH